MFIALESTNLGFGSKGYVSLACKSGFFVGSFVVLAFYRKMRYLEISVF